MPKRCKDCRNKNSKKYVVTQKEKRPSSLVAAALFFAERRADLVLADMNYEKLKDVKKETEKPGADALISMVQ